MGRPKQLLPLNGTPAIRRCLEAIFSSGIEDVIVVLGGPPRHEDARRIRESISGLPIRTAINSATGSDMSESVRAGLREIAGAPAILVFPADQPLVAPASIKLLLEEHERNPRSILIPLFEGRRGHPALFPWELIRGVFDGPCLRDIIRGNPGRVSLIETGDIGVVLDMDTPEDYRRMLGVLDKNF